MQVRQAGLRRQFATPSASLDRCDSLNSPGATVVELIRKPRLQARAQAHRLLRHPRNMATASTRTVVRRVSIPSGLPCLPPPSHSQCRLPTAARTWPQLWAAPTIRRCRAMMAGGIVVFSKASAFLKAGGGAIKAGAGESAPSGPCRALAPLATCAARVIVLSPNCCDGWSFSRPCTNPIGNPSPHLLQACLG